MKSYKEFRQEGFETVVLKGMSDYFNEEPWGEQALARSHCLEEIAKTPDQADRDQIALRFAPVLWRFDDTKFLGEPPPDKGKWLEVVRKRLPSLRLSPQGEKIIVEKLQDSGNSEQGGADGHAASPRVKAGDSENSNSNSGGSSR